MSLGKNTITVTVLFPASHVFTWFTFSLTRFLDLFLRCFASLTLYTTFICFTPKHVALPTDPYWKLQDAARPPISTSLCCTAPHFTGNHHTTHTPAARGGTRHDSLLHPSPPPLSESVPPLGITQTQHVVTTIPYSVGPRPPHRLCGRLWADPALPSCECLSLRGRAETDQTWRFHWACRQR